MNDSAPSSRFRITGIVLALAVLGTVGMLRFAQQRALGKEGASRKAEVEAGPRVHTLVVGTNTENAPLSFQGEALPMTVATLYAKIGGFLKEIRVDKGSRVQKGDLLAVVESPETDKQTQALKFAYENLQRTADKVAQLGREKIASDLDVDNARAAAEVARQTWLSQAQTEGYQKLVAPFSGVITARFVDPGAFIQNASTSMASQPIVTVSDISRLRVTFFLDQASAALVRVGQGVDVSPAEHPDAVSQGQISRVSGALDLRTRTMLVEVDVDNRDGRYLSGGYMRVSLRLPKGSDRLDLPSEALLMKGEKPFAATLEGNHVRLQALILGEDVGSRVRVLKGLSAGTRIILNPSPGLKDGDQVQALD
jgi:membrane fusion protein (multidrug efflux system)